MWNEHPFIVKVFALQLQRSPSQTPALATQEEANEGHTQPTKTLCSGADSTF